MTLMRQRLGRWWRWVTATRARRSALTLAVLAAMAAPFVTGSYEETSYIRTVYLTAEDRTEIIALWGEDPNCEEAAKSEPPDWVEAKMNLKGKYVYWIRFHDYDSRLYGCFRDHAAFKNGYRIEGYLSRPRYIATNGAVMLATLVVTFFALTEAMAAVRKWWRWLW